MNAGFYAVFVLLVSLLGYLCHFISKKIRISLVLLLLLAGFGLRNIRNYGDSFFGIVSEPLVFAIAEIGIILMIFESSTKPRIKHIDTFHTDAFKIFLFSLIFNLVILTTIVQMSILASLALSILFSLLITSTMALFSKSGPQSLAELLEKESAISTPVLLVASYLLLKWLNLGSDAFEIFSPNLKPYFLAILLGLGVGIILSIVFFKTAATLHKKEAKPLIVFLTILASYLLAEFLGGEGVVSVAVFALFFGNIHLENKEATFKMLEAILFPFLIFITIILGIKASIGVTSGLFLTSLLIYFVYILIRYFSIMIAMPQKKLKFKEKIIMTLGVQKGTPLILVSAVILLQNLKWAGQIAQLSILLLLYSSAIASIVHLFTEKKSEKADAEMV